MSSSAMALFDCTGYSTSPPYEILKISFRLPTYPPLFFLFHIIYSPRFASKRWLEDITRSNTHCYKYIFYILYIIPFFYICSYTVLYSTASLSLLYCNHNITILSYSTRNVSNITYDSMECTSTKNLSCAQVVMLSCQMSDCQKSQCNEAEALKRVLMVWLELIRQHR